jgi:hypothetical protein
MNRNPLKRIMANLDPTKAILGMARPFFPQFVGYLNQVNKPVAEGGQLQDGERIAYFSIAVLNNQPQILCVFLKFENNQLIVSRQEVLSDFNQLENE